jgi:hypothetical protein|tara:strand:+ start:141 stop:539 length:399 start_codon:yes stop_codon:yes gene_type:complete
MPQVLEVSAKPIDKPVLVLPKVDQLNMKDVKWIVVTPDNWEAAVIELKKTGRPVVLFGLTDQGYENLGLNFSDIRALVQQQQAIIVAYEGYYNASEQALDKANNSINNVNSQVDAVNSTTPKSPLSKYNPFK